MSDSKREPAAKDSKSASESMLSPQVVFSTTIVTSTILASVYFYKNYLRRIPNSSFIPPKYFRSRRLLGVVTSVGDGDNFHFFHTPGGLLAGWGWIRPIPEAVKKSNRGRKPLAKAENCVKKTVVKQTIHVRLNGVDAPECAHFGKPAQPYAQEALAWLRSTLLDRRVRLLPLAPDQYGRTVGEVHVQGNRWYNFFRKFNVSAEMLKNGWATLYEAKSGAEFNGRKALFQSLQAEAQRKRKGIFIQKKFETPREYKNKYK